MIKAGTGGGPIDAWLGTESRLLGGKLEFKGCLRIDGEAGGTEILGASLVVGEGARVSGHLDVEQLTVLGRFEGTARVGEAAVIAKGGRFTGEIILKKPVLSVQEGGSFQGKVRLADAPAPVSGKS